MRVRVPATSANLGPGFDCLGVAWQSYNEIDFQPGGSGLSIAGCPAAYCNEQNLAYQGYCAALTAAGWREIPSIAIRFGRTDIPVSRGMGSSAALIAGGIVAANALHGLKLSEKTQVQLAAALEGHPDNVAPALLGGLVVSAMEAGNVHFARCPLSPVWQFLALIPDTELETQKARAVLPAAVPRSDAVFNIGHAALLLRALETGDGALLRFALDDRLHQPYRLSLIPGAEAARKIALDAGADGLCISGAGSTLLVIAREAEKLNRIAREIAEEFPRWEARKLQIAQHGAEILPEQGEK